ncbi:MAG: TlpA family protein disulfide reductase [Bacteroidetes bacterium]|nr:TlpA family protein disulfide reductase [Bacteroidota bacterium]
MKSLVTLFILVTTLMNAQIKTGIWRGVFLLNPEKQLELPFNFDVKNTNGKITLVIHNAQERITVDEVELKKDSFNFKMPVFDTEFRTRLTDDGTIKGVWINHTKKENNTIAFTAQFDNKNRFIVPTEKPHHFYDGKWETTFSPGTADSSKAIGVFKHITGTSIVEGTFMTETGDYRYLEGTEHNGKLYLSCFDGSHAFLFLASHDEGDMIKGDFYSGSSWHETWIARRNDKFELQDPESLTYLKNPNEKIDFSFFNSKNEKISLSDPKYKNKAIIIQIMGSWCPNCMDESAYLSKLYKQYNKAGLEIIGLAYERTSDNEKAKANILRLTKRFDIGYDILLPGVTGKDKASETLPFLNKVMAFPTTIFLDKNHIVKSIYTGFNGPATGKAYEEYTIKTEKLIGELLK